MKAIIQKPSVEGNWLYNDRADGTREFATEICRPDDSPAWLECTDAEKVTWNMDFSKDIDLSNWNPTDKGTTFLQNFREHIALRLTSNGSGKTLTLSQAVYSAIWDSNGDPVNYGEGDPKTQACIDIDSTLVSKGWGVDKAS